MANVACSIGLEDIGVGTNLYDSAVIRQDGSLVWILCLLQAVGGLVIACGMKGADIFLKCFGYALSISINCLVSVFVLSSRIGACAALVAEVAYILKMLEDAAEVMWSRICGAAKIMCSIGFEINGVGTNLDDCGSVACNPTFDRSACCVANAACATGREDNGAGTKPTIRLWKLLGIADGVAKICFRIVLWCVGGG